jgi:predicted DNA-binding protein (UPF0251 family)
LVEVHLCTDAWEALRLCDHEGLEQEEAARRMGVSRPTVSRILERARKAVARALVEGCSLVIDVPADAVQECGTCRKTWPGPASLTRCPSCGSCGMYLLVHPDCLPNPIPAVET